MNNKTLSHLQYSWWTYVLWALVIVVVWIAVFDAIITPNANEEIGILAFSDENVWASLDTDLKNNVASVTQQSIKEIGIGVCKIDSSSMPDTVSARLPVKDLFIFPENLVVSTDENGYNPAKVFYTLTPEKRNDLFGDILADIEFLYLDGLAYGIYLNNPNDDVVTNFERFYNGATRYVLFFSPYSVNLNQMYDKGKSGDSAGIDVARYLVSVAE